MVCKGNFMRPTHPLSRREAEVLQQLLAGKSNQQIGAALHISERTVEFHLNHIYQKYQVASRMELVLNLGQSTGAQQDAVRHNEARPNLRDWVASFPAVAAGVIEELRMRSSSFSAAPAAGQPLTFWDAIRAALTQYARFDGRASRAEFWWFFVFVLLLSSALTLLHETLGEVFLIAVLLPFLAVGARRLHDVGKSAAWLWYLLVPVGGLVILGVLWAQPSAPGGDLPGESETGAAPPPE
jgi:DNA-binding CsgD family transcriptional regulator